MMIKFICKNCGKTYWNYPSRIGISFFCSQSCNASYRLKGNKFRVGKPPANKGKKMPEISGKNHYNWKGGKMLSSDGYVLIYQPNHPNSDKWRYIREHRLVMEEHLGRYLKSNEFIHHKNGIKTDNRIENLELFNEHQHKSIEAKKRWEKYRSS